MKESALGDTKKLRRTLSKQPARVNLADLSRQGNHVKNGHIKSFSPQRHKGTKKDIHGVEENPKMPWIYRCVCVPLC